MHRPQRLLLPFAVSLLFTSLVAAQDLTGVIAGVVSDSSGAVIPAARVSIVNADTGVRAWQAQGFRGFEVKGLNISVGDRSRVDAKMEPGQVQETVTVNGGSVAQLESDSSSISTTVDPGQVSGFPIANRDILNLLALVPGVSSGGDARV